MAYFSLIIFPCWLIARKCHSDMGSMLYPAVRPGPDHKDMAPRILSHLVANNYENAPDKFGRKNAMFYRNFFRQENTRRPKLV